MALLLNAVDAMEKGGRLAVRTGKSRSRPDEVFIDVEDTGTGIPRSELAKIFEPFYTTKPPGQGTGLGLSVCYGIVQEHGGRVEVESQLGEGQVKVLVIEDDRTVGQYVKRGLEEHRIQADLVDDGMEGLRLASGGLYDLIVLDLRLPGMTGLEVLRTLRDRGVTTPVLVLTAQDAVDFKVQALRMGADDYVTKPFAFEELLARVEALSRRPKQLKSPVLRVADLELDTATHTVQRGGRTIELTPKEYAVLEYLMRHAGRVLSRTLITEYAWDYHFDPGTNIVDVVINRLRKKVDSGHEQKLVHTVRGVGYVVKG
jgi:two-component system copper resistance phosphate regulon response regulator CusR